MSDQNTEFSYILNLSSWLFEQLLSPEDIVSLYQCKKILKSSKFIYTNITAYLSENNAASSIYISINLATVVYQWIYSSWFMYFSTSLSGMKKIYKFIFQNPLLGIFFYSSFYFKFLSETDKSKFNQIAQIFNLPLHEYFTSSKFLSEFIDNISLQLENTIIHGYKNVTKEILKRIIFEIVSKSIQSLPKSLTKIIKTEEKTIQTLSEAAVYISSRSVETQRDYDEFIDYISKNMKTIKTNVKKQVGGKKKLKKKLLLQKIVQKQTTKRETICLDSCKDRPKTYMGCYCEGECGPTMFSGENWCYVDPTKCKKGKYLPKYMGYSYDKCNPDIKTLKCFNGIKYVDCKIK
jgi:hypothetical protein